MKKKIKENNVSTVNRKYVMFMVNGMDFESVILFLILISSFFQEIRYLKN